MLCLPTIIASGTVLVSSAVWLLKSWIGKRIEKEVSHIYDVRLEERKAALKRSGDLEIEHIKAVSTETRTHLEAFASSLSVAHTASAERRIKALDAVWTYTISFRDSVMQHISLLDLLTDVEIGEATTSTNPMTQEMLKLLPHSKVWETLQRIRQDQDQHRPYVSERFWATYWSYQALLGSVLLHFSTTYHHGKLTPWRSGERPKELLELLIPEREQTNFKDNRGTLGLVIQITEGALTRMIAEVLSGKDNAQMTFEELTRLHKLMLKPPSLE